MNFSIATWNCADGFIRKIPFLDELDADIITVQELRLAGFEQAAPLFNRAVFQPSSTARGIAVFCRRDWPLQRIEYRRRKSDQCYLPVTVETPAGKVDILASWVKPVEDYVRPSQRAFRAFFKASTSPHKLVLGDLNQNRIFDENRRLGLFKKTEAIMARNGMRSLYHETTGEDFGAETRPTHFLTYNFKRPYHLDYIYASHALKTRAFSLFPENPWATERRSDHLPMRGEVEFT